MPQLSSLLALPSEVKKMGEGQGPQLKQAHVWEKESQNAVSGNALEPAWLQASGEFSVLVNLSRQSVSVEGGSKWNQTCGQTN